MSGGGYIVAYSNGLYGRAATKLLKLGGIQATAALGGAVVQLADSTGRLFTLYERVAPGTDWDLFNEPLTATHGVHLPDPTRMVVCPFDCRWPDLLTQVAALIARTTEDPVWVIDGDGIVWDAEAVDPMRVRL